MTTEAIPLIVRRIIPAKREVLFDAFDAPDKLARWFRPTEEVGLVVEAYEFTEGGAFRLTYHMPDGRMPVVAGRFLVIDRPALIAFSWVWQAPDPLEGIEMDVTFEFEARDKGVEVRVTHRGIPSDMACSIHEDGWIGTLGFLDRFLQ